MTLKRPTGLSVAVATPMHEDGSLDLRALTRHVKWLVEEGVDTLMPCGTTGESATLSPEEQRRVIETCLEASGGRAPVFAGAGSNSTEPSLGLARAARDAGADGLLLVTPYYNRPSQAGLLAHYRALAEAGGGLPVVLYNVPNRTGVNLHPDTVFRLSEVECVVGVKEASGDLDQVMTLIAGRPDGFLVLSGDDGVALAIMALGGDGVVSVAANEVPGQMKALVTAALEGRMDRARELHYQLLPLMRANFVESNPVPLKTALHRMGRMGPYVRGPLAPLTPASAAVLDRALAQLGLMEKKS